MKKNFAKYGSSPAKDQTTTPKADLREGRLYQKIGRSGENESNALSWIRSWKQYKIADCSPEIQQSLKDFVRVNYDIAGKTASLEYESELPSSKDHWTPSPAERLVLAAMEGDEKTWREIEFFREWSQIQTFQNAQIKHRNDMKKVQKDEIVKLGGEAYKRMINSLMGRVLEDMTADSRREIEGWTRDPDEVIQLVGGETRAMIADTLDQAYEKGDWLFLFEAVQKTHLVRPLPKEDTAVRARQNLMVENLKKIKHTSGSFERWLQKFEDYQLICETAGCVIEDVDMRNYLMDALNPKIFARLLTEWRKTVGRPTFADTYVGLKMEVRTEYNAICTEPDLARVIAEVMFNGAGKGSDKSEISLEAKEISDRSGSEAKGETKAKIICWICDKPGHRMSECHHYDKSRSREENRENFKKRESEKAAAKSPKKEKKEAKTEKVGKCAVVACDCKSFVVAEIPDLEMETKTAELKTEHVLIMGVKPNQVDFIYDTGTHHGVVGERDTHLMTEIEEDPVLLEGVGGHTSLSLQIGNTLFGKARVLKHRQGSVLVSNYSTRGMFQVINPDEDRFILRGWDHNPRTKGREYVFIRDEERYGDPLLHCTMPIKVAKSFAGIEKFYDPPREPNISDEESKETIARVEIAHRKWNHASAQELCRINGVDLGATGVSDKEVAVWKKLHGDFCTGCIEGTLKEHKRVASTKPLVATKPGEIGTADLMFVEGRAEVKTPLYVHVDVYSKAIIGVPMKNKTMESCLEAVKATVAHHRVASTELKKLVFDRESAIMALEPEILEQGVVLDAKAAGQKVGLAEVSIRLIRGKARSSKAGVRERYGYLPANQFNMDLCLDTIGVLNRIPKEGKPLTPLEAFTGKKPDWVRDLRAEWGETVVVKKPKGIASDLKVSGEWCVIVRRIMNGSGVLKVYLIQSRKFAYRLKFRRAKAPDWVLGALNSISVNQSIGLEDPAENPEDITEVETTTLMASDPKMLPEPGGESEEQEPGVDVQDLNDDQIQEALNVIQASEDANREVVVDVLPQPVHDPVAAVDANRPLTRSNVGDRERLELERRAQLYGEWVASGRQEPEPGDVGRVVFNRSHRRTEANVIRAQEVLRRAYLERYGGATLPEDDTGELLEHEQSNILYQQAMKERPEAAEAALLKEVQKAEEKKIWHPVHLKDLTPEQRKLILPMMKSYVEKYHPDSTFDKSKVRVLVRGDLQRFIGESEGPVCRFESILLLLSLAAHLDLEVFKVDISAAYMNTPMNKEQVKHRWVHLDKDVTKLLLRLNRAYYQEFVQEDGTMIVEMDKLMYGFKEAAHFWNIELIRVFLAAGYAQCKKDKCVLVKRSSGKLSICGITVDDCLFVATRDEAWVQEQIKMLADAFEELTTERGDEIGIVGVQVKMDRVGKRVLLSQRKFADKVIEVFDVKKSSPNPALSDVMGTMMALRCWRIKESWRPECRPPRQGPPPSSGAPAWRPPLSCTPQQNMCCSACTLHMRPMRLL